MIDIYLDCETTGINCYCDEIIEAYFYIDDYLRYHYKAKPLFWSHEAEVIHGISEGEASMYPDKSEAIPELINWFSNIKDSFRFITYTNKQSELGTINFDVAILCNELDLNGYPFYYLENKLNMKEPLSVHSLARELGAKGTFIPYRNMETNRPSYSQENVYKQLFDETYNSHNAKEDVMALVRIYNELLRLKDENKLGLFGSSTNNTESLA